MTIYSVIAVFMVAGFIAFCLLMLARREPDDMLDLVRKGERRPISLSRIESVDEFFAKSRIVERCHRCGRVPTLEKPTYGPWARVCRCGTVRASDKLTVAFGRTFEDVVENWNRDTKARVAS